MKKKKIPLRTCVVTKVQLPKRELIRIARDNTGRVFIDENSKANGRGAYLQRDIEVVKKAQKSKVLNKYLEAEIPDSIYEELQNIILNQ
ncbi:MAG: RNase P modulator RnpM [Bacilli bacterium]|jgi:predicted RNA-binding protein YlxR (DUF448 family)